MSLFGPFAEAFGYTASEFRALTIKDRLRLAQYLKDRHDRQVRAGKGWKS